MPKVLIVEDDLMFALDLRHEVTRLGYEVIGIAKSSDEAQIATAENRPDLALMDISIAGRMDGIETAHLLQVNYRLPVIFLTSAIDQHSISRAIQEKPYAYLVKPFKRLELKASMDAALRDSGLGDAEENVSNTKKATVESILEEAPVASPVHEVLFMPATAEQQAERELLEAKQKQLYELMNLPDKRQVTTV
jgi:DNA-binding response OmpR family regulator